jgi:ABC-type polysaccharide/polyol phosphate export permease
MRALPEVWVHRHPSRVTYGPLDGEKARVGAFRERTNAWLHVLSVLTRNDFRARYRAQALGTLWSLLNPLVTMSILSVIFTRVFHSTIAHFPVFLLIGLVSWQWVTSSLLSATAVFVAHSDVVKRTVFPRQLLPISAVLSYGINFCIESLVVLASVMVWPSAFRLSPALLLVPLILGLMAAMLIGLSLATSVLNVVYRDVAYLVNTGLTLLYWLTPIIYPPEVLPEPWRTVLHCNPLGVMLIALRDVAMNGRAPELVTWAAMVGSTASVLCGGWIVFRHYERMVLDYV